MTENLPSKPDSGILLYQTEDGHTRIQVRLENETVWLTQKLIAELFQKDIRTINEHVQNIFDEKELAPESVIRKFRITALDGKSYDTMHFNLDVIIAVGYRVKSHRGTQFRIWATQRLREYIVKGFTMDDERLKQAGGGNYFEELLARIRDIRSSEKIFWRKVLDIYATSIDYDPTVEMTQKFFQTVQNKMHWAAHGHTAAEIVAARADAAKPHMGLTSWTGTTLGPSDIEIAKNYLKKDEIEALNRIVTAYLEFAELQALNRHPMHMRDWIAKLDEFLRMSNREILADAGTMSHDEAIAKARAEFEKYGQIHLNDPWPVEEQFLNAARDLRRITASRKPLKKRKS
jgi:hypothetical protein